MRATNVIKRFLAATVAALTLVLTAHAALALAASPSSLAAHLVAMSTGSNVYATSSATRVQVSFEVGDVVASTQIVRAGDSLVTPAPPTAPAGMVFDRWEVGGTDITPYLDTVLASADLTHLADAAGATPDGSNLVSTHAQAVFATAHAIRFHQYTRDECAESDANAQVFCYSLLTSGRADLEAASLAYVPLVEGVDAELVGWEAYGEGDAPLATYDKAATVENVTADLDLYPKLSSGFWVSFATGDGAPLLENAFVLDDGSESGILPASSLPTEQSLAGDAYDPTTHTYADSYRGWYQGWTLEGWYEEEALVTKVEGDLTLADDKTLYAHWTPRDDTTYTIANMVENGAGTAGSGAFSLKSAVVMTGTTGDATLMTDSTELTNAGYHVATEEELAARPELEHGATTIAGDGTSVKYQYWFRNWYRIRFYTGNRRNPGNVYLDAPKVKRGEALEDFAGSQLDYMRGRFQYSDGQYKGVYMTWSGGSVTESWAYYAESLLDGVASHAPHMCTINAYYDAGVLDSRRGLRVFTTLTGDEDPSQEVSTMTFATGTYDFVKTQEYWEWGAHNKMDVNTYAKNSRRGFYTLGYRYAGGLRDTSTFTQDHAYISENGIYEADTNAYWKIVWQARNAFELNFANVDGVLVDAGKPNHYDEVLYQKRLEGFFPFTSSDTLRKVGNTVYRFKGWYSSLYSATNWEREESAVDLIDPTSVKMPAATTTYYAAWEPLSYELVFDANGGELALSEGATLSDDKSLLTFAGVESGKLITKPATPTKTVGGVDYTFVGWYRDEALTKAWDFQTATLQGPTRLYAKWVKGRTYTVSYHDANGVEIEGVDTTRYRYGATVAAAPEQPDATQTEPFLGWSLVQNNAAYVVGQSFTVSSNTDLFAVYGTAMPGAAEGDVEAGAPVLTLDSNYPAGIEGHVSQTLQVARANAAVTLPAALAGASAPGYHVAGWTASQDGGDEYQTGSQVAVAGDTTLYARWEANQLQAELSATPVYDGQPHRPVPAVAGWDGSDLVAGTDYDVEYPDDVTSAGEHIVTVRGLGLHAFSEPVTLTYSIAPRPVTLAADSHASRVGEGLAELTWTVQPALVDAGDLGEIAASTEADGTAPGSWPITLAYVDNANYDVTVVNGTYRVSAATLVVSAQGWSGTYDGAPHAASVTLSPSAAYEGGATVYYSDTTPLTADNYLEAGMTVPPSRTRAGSTDVYYYVVGTTSYVPDASEASGTVAVTVARAPLTVTANGAAATYGDEPSGAGVTVDGLVGGDTVDTSSVTLSFVTRDGSSTYVPGSAAGTYRIVPSGLEAPDYDVTYVPGTLTVSRRTIGLTWSSADTMAYTGTPRTYAGATATGLFGSDQLSLDVAGATATDAGDYVAQVTGISGASASNYSLPAGDKTHPWHVTQASNSATAAIDDWIYGATAATPTAVAGFGVSTATFEYADTATGPFAATPPTQAGTHYVRAYIAETVNWAGATSAPVPFEVERRQVAISGLVARGKVYDGTTNVTLAGDATLTAVPGRARSGPVAGDDVAVAPGTAVFDSAAAGERTVSFAGYALTGDAAPNYELVGQPGSATATISPRPLTVTAPSPTIAYGDEPPAYAATFDGFAEGEDASVLTGNPLPTCSYHRGDPAGTYVVAAPELVTNGNYDLTLVPGTLTVAQATNSWVVEPAISSWSMGQEHAVPAGQAAFGTTVFEYASRQADESLGPWQADVPSEPGSYTMRASVLATGDWTGLEALVDFEVSYDTLTYEANSLFATGATEAYRGSTGDEVTVAACGFSWPDHSFLGWNTAADGSGDAYAPGSTYRLGAGTDVLYAQWEPAGELAYVGNGATSGAVAPQGGRAGTRVVVSKNGFELSGHTFVEWNTAPDGSGTSYRPGDSFVLNVGGDVLYARWRENPAPASGRSMYRLYNPNSGEHFYTASAQERDAIAAAGWRYEGVGWTAPVSGDPVYRLYNANAGDHHYTLDAGERDALVTVGWVYEGVGWNSDRRHTRPVWREYNPYALAGAHNFTTSEREHVALCGLGWRGEGIAWYGM